MATYRMAAVDARSGMIELTTAYVLTGESYPGRMVVGSEVVYVIGGAGTTQITVLRGQDGTDAVAHAVGTITDANVPTAGGATPTLAEVLAAGNDAGGVAQTNPGLGTDLSPLEWDAETGVLGQPAITAKRGAYLGLDPDYGDGSGSAAQLSAGNAQTGKDGGDNQINGGGVDGLDNSPAIVKTRGAKANGDGGDVTIQAGTAASNSTGRGGDVHISLGAIRGGTTGRGGALIFDNLPSSDPLVLGALWCDPAASFVLKVSQGPT